MLNPFITKGYVGAEYFCDRQQETSDLLSLLTNGNNVALISPRRYGKTDLLRHCFAQPEIQEKYNTFIVDVYATRTEEEFVACLASSILEALKPKGRKAWEHFLSVLNSIKQEVSFDINGMPVWNVSIGNIRSTQTTLGEIFSYIDQSERPCLVAIDEFQQITHYANDNIEATLRTHVQYCKNASFVFSGSHQHLMGSIFTSPSRPFYQSVTLYTLHPLPLEKYRDFCLYHFRQADKELEESAVDKLYHEFEGVTYYMQRVMNELFAYTPKGGKCGIADVEPAVQRIIDLAAPIYEDLLYQLPEKQCKLLLAIAHEGKATNLTSGSFSKRHGIISPSSVKSAMPALIDRGLVVGTHGVYQVYDKFLQLWLSQRTIY